MPTSLKNRFFAFLQDERGQDIVEYSLLLVLIGALVMIYLTQAGASISSIMSKISGKLDAANNAISES